MQGVEERLSVLAADEIAQKHSQSEAHRPPATAEVGEAPRERREEFGRVNFVGGGVDDDSVAALPPDSLADDGAVDAPVPAVFARALKCSAEFSRLSCTEFAFPAYMRNRESISTSNASTEKISIFQIYDHIDEKMKRGNFVSFVPRIFF